MVSKPANKRLRTGKALTHARDYAGIGERYARDVVAGKIVACKWVKLACKRHLDDLERAKNDPDWGFYFDLWEADNPCDLLEKLEHVEGNYDPPTIVLQPVQIWELTTIFGWRRSSDGGRRFSEVYIEMARKGGKAEYVENLIPTPDGMRRMGDLEAGDYVFGSDGKPTRVVATTEVMHGLDCMEVEFSTGERIVVAADHLWEVNQNINATNNRRRWSEAEDDLLRQHYPHGGVNAMADLLPDRSRFATNKRAGDLGIKSLSRNRGAGRLEQPRKMGYDAQSPVVDTRTIAAPLTYGAKNENRYSVTVAAPVELPDADLPVPPYTLGAWLGDGDSCASRLTSHYDDTRVRDVIVGEGVSVDEHRSQSDTTGRFILGRGGKKNSLQTRLRALGVLKNKHIPALYLRGSYEQRLELLRGLMDTDGTASKRGQCSFTNCNERLARDTFELICSLGMKATWSQGIAKLNGREIAPYYQVSFYPPHGYLVFWLDRKRARQNARPSDTRADTRAIVSVTPVESVPVKCIQVEARNGLYLTGRSYIVTHNSALTAGVSVFGLTCEAEVGPQVIIAASTGAQAAKVFDPARKMVERNADLREAFGLKTFVRSITCAANGGYMQTINSKGSTQDGHNPHMAVLDELHAHTDRALYDVIKSAFGSRNNPLLWSITTAGFSTTGICYEVRTYATKVLEGIFEADHFFGVIFTLDDAVLDIDGTVLVPADDPYDPKVWIKANPLLGITPKLSFMHAAAADAKASPAAEGNFKTKNLNIWLHSNSAWLNMVRWRECADPSLDWSAFEGLDCWIGLDLADKDDICAAVIAAIDRDGRLILKSLFWLPEAVLNNPTHAQGSTAAPYRLWAEQGHLQLTPGDWVDHNEIEAQLREWVDRFSVRAIVGDQFAAFQQMASRLNTDLATPDNPLAHILSKNARNVTDPAKELEARVKSGPARLAHDGNPVMDWMASNVVISRRTDGTILPKKETADSPNKIDGIDAAVNAIQPMLGAVKEPTMQSYLEREEPIFF